MFDLQWPWLLLLAPLPLLMRLVKAKKRTEAALRVPFFAEAQRLNQVNIQGRGNNKFKLMLLWVIWCSCVLALSDPQWVGEPVEMPSSGRDLMMAVDMSESMRQVDMTYQGQRITRLMAVKKVVGDFVERRTTDRMGLILFADQAYLQAPLTYDRTTVKDLLLEAEIGIAGRATAIGDAIGLAVKRLRDKPASSRVLVLLTDGANNAGELTPAKATELAHQAGIKIYTIAFGADRMEVPGFFGNRTVNPSADLDEKTLNDIAEKTGGQYFRARSIEELNNIHHELDRLEPVEDNAETFRPVESLFYWPLALAFILSLLIALSEFGFMAALNLSQARSRS